MAQQFISDSLRPCPFCGGRAQPIITSTTSGPGGADVGKEFVIECSGCNLRSPKKYQYSISIDIEAESGIKVRKDERLKAITEWNTRVTEAAGILETFIEPDAYTQSLPWETK